ncbi:protein phosphatase 2C domain-containing protein [Patescibacteria group bacterium]|nr:protein phosphatase 2C domain-containing protein [Patescibacteria group bacterium]
MADDLKEGEEISKESLKRTPIEVGFEVISSPRHADYSADRVVGRVLAGGGSGIIAAIDGVGSGGRASALAAEAVQKRITNLESMFLEPPTVNRAAEVLKGAILEGRDQIKDLQREGASEEVDTTVSAAIVAESPGGKRRFLVIANVGDSRIYRYKPTSGEIEQLTTDHTLAQRLVESGQLTEGEVFGHDDSYKLTKSVGSLKKAEEIDIKVVKIDEGDVFLAVSDGVTDNMRKDEFQEALQGEYRAAFDRKTKKIEPQKIAEGIARRALKIMTDKSIPHRKKDDICVAVLKTTRRPA